jgi:hypothetical protein
MIFNRVSIIGLLLLLAAPLQGADFSADTRIVTAARTMESKFFFAGDRWRMEETLPEGRRVTIFRQDQKRLYVLWPDKKRYMIQPLPEREFKILSTRKPGEETERTELGKEKVAGYPTTKYRVTYNVQGKPMTSIEWFSSELGMVIRSEGEDRSWTNEFTNIKKRRSPRKLFDIPKDYQQLSARDVLVKPHPNTLNK